MNKMEISFSARLENESFARSAIASFIAPLNPTLNEVIEIKTIVAEAVSNAIIHGYNQNEDDFVVIQVTTKDREIEIIVVDSGKGMDNLEEVQLPFYTTLKELEHTGMGFTIIKTLADSLELESIMNFGTKLIIKKRLIDYSE